MTEWLKVRAWKVRIPQKGIVGSNPAFSAEIQVIRRQQYAKTRSVKHLRVFLFLLPCQIWSKNGIKTGR